MAFNHLKGILKDELNFYDLSNDTITQVVKEDQKEEKVEK